MVVKLKAATQVKAIIILYVQYGLSDIIENITLECQKFLAFYLVNISGHETKIILLVLFPNNCSILYGFSNSYLWDR